MINSVAWVVWHIARAEDVGVNRFVVDGRQVLEEGNWQEKLRIPNRDHGGGMTNAEMTELSRRIDLPALRAYYNAVRSRTVAVVNTLTPAQLDEVPDTVAPSYCYRGGHYSGSLYREPSSLPGMEAR